MGNWQGVGMGACYVFEPNSSVDRVDVDGRGKKASCFVRELSDEATSVASTDEPVPVVEAQPAAHRSVAAAHPRQAPCAPVPTLLNGQPAAVPAHLAKPWPAPNHPGFGAPSFVAAPGFALQGYFAAPAGAVPLAQEPPRLVAVPTHVQAAGSTCQAFLLPPAAPSKVKEQESDYLDKFPLGQNTCDPETNAVPLVSLGCYCGPKLSFQKMGRGSETLPFDWLRSTIDGLLHFIRTDFSGFFDFVTEQKVPGVQAMTMYRSPIHSFWHDDPTDPSMHERYHRRFARFKAIDARSGPVLFTRVAVSTEELMKIPELLGELVQRCGDGVRLLVILNFQERISGPAFVEGLPNLMLYFLSSEVHRRESTAFGLPYVEPVRHGLDWAVGRPLQAHRFPHVQAARAAGDESYWGYNGLGGLKAFEGLA